MSCRKVVPSNLPPLDRNSFIGLLAKSTNLSQLAQTHAQIIINGYKNDISTVTKLTHKLCDFKAIDYARNLFLSIPKPDLFLFNVLIRGFSNNNSPLSSIGLYTHLRKNTFLSPDNFTYAFAVSASAGLSRDNVGVLLHGHAVVDGYWSDLFVGSSLVDFYFGSSRVEYARKVFDRMPERDTVLWNTMISGMVKNSCFEDSIEIFKEMVGSGVRLDHTSVASVLPAATEMQSLSVGKEIQCLALKLGFHSHVHTLTGFISLYSKLGDMEMAALLFEQINHPDLISYNALVSGYNCNGNTQSALRVFKKLLGAGEKVNSSTIVGLVPVFSPFGHLNLTFSIHSFCVKSGIISEPSVSTAFTTVYYRLNEIGFARTVFDESKEKPLASWNAMISGYTQNGFTEEAISLFQQMESSNVHPNPVTITSILSACAQLGALSLGRWVHDLITREGFLSNLYVLTALIDMYAKCGSIAEARTLFNNAPQKNVVTWNSMISGYGLHGLGPEAVNLFTEMLHSGVSPSQVTFLSVMHACSHAGLVTEGNEIFHSMVNEHGLEPLAEHYACMVDIFGRAGELHKAMEFIEGMKTEPGPEVWGTLLGACMIHKDSNLAHFCSEKLSALECDNVGHYVSLSNIYTVGRDYSRAASIRQAVKQKNLMKTPGCTLIEIGMVPHVFRSGDLSHPQTKVIYLELERLTQKIMEAGYRAETVSALHDVEEEEKEMTMKVHSEKLAIAFGLIATEPGEEIRIFKNLRVCVDCHSATKFISKVTGRVIVVRDANRFHHFKDGVCSCGDYW